MLALVFWLGLTLGIGIGIAYAPEMRDVRRRLRPARDRGVVIPITRARRR